jgi:SPX domain protein involved in polyphosphate accumulation
MKLEYKFFIGNNDLDKLRNKLFPFVVYDEYSKDELHNEYTVRSIYFDSSRFNFYHEKIDGIKIRKKLRIRGYDNIRSNSIIFLEVKNKYNGFIGKNRAPLNYHDLGKLLKSRSIETYTLTNNGFVDSVKDNEIFLHHMIKDELKPTMLIVYEREAYFSKFNNRLRITIDKNLRYYEYPNINNLYKDSDLEHAVPGYSILEIKFDYGYPEWLRNIIQEFNLQRRSISKYTVCIDSSSKIDPFKKKFNISDSINNWDSHIEDGI